MTEPEPPRDQPARRDADRVRADRDPLAVGERLGHDQRGEQRRREQDHDAREPQRQLAAAERERPDALDRRTVTIAQPAISATRGAHRALRACGRARRVQPDERREARREHRHARRARPARARARSARRARADEPRAPVVRAPRSAARGRTPGRSRRARACPGRRARCRRARRRSSRRPSRRTATALEPNSSQRSNVPSPRAGDRPRGVDDRLPLDARAGSGPPGSDGPSATPIGRKREFIERRREHRGADRRRPAARIAIAVNCAEPANTIADIAIAAPAEQPGALGDDAEGQRQQRCRRSRTACRRASRRAGAAAVHWGATRPSPTACPPARRPA